MSVAFTPLRMGPLEAAGRVFKTATAETRASEDGFVTDELIDAYDEWASGGTPLILTGNLYIAPSGKSTYRMCGVDADDKVAGLARLAAAVHRHGGKLIGQLNHCGRQVIQGHTGVDDPISASNVSEPTMGTRPRALRGDEIPGVIEAFAAAAVRLRDAGFDGVQVHLAHGYLLRSFDAHQPAHGRVGRVVLKNRARLARGGARGAAASALPAAQAQRPRPPPGRRGLDTGERPVARWLEADGADAVEVSNGHYESGFPMIAGTSTASTRARGAASGGT
jgi:2,4-dienoyl-CoA reductase-like NADH-dependent reductase (Old Yellow Enzyme family)